MKKRNVWLRRFAFNALKAQFIEIIDFLNKKNIPYYLEGGALLGIVRDGDLLPWDNDTDLSINFDDRENLFFVANEVQRLGWRCKFKHFVENTAFATKSDIRVLKISDYWLGIFKGPTKMDIFLKYPMDEYMCWSAANRYMQVDRKYYDGFDLIKWNGRKLRVPRFYEDYLTEKYGDWSIKIKDWSVKSEGTIFGAEKNVRGPLIIDQDHKIKN